jgi:GAF domain-containing protein
MDEDISNQTQSSQEIRLTEQLERLVRSIRASGHAILPRNHDALLQSIVNAATRIFGAAAASIALIDEERGVLEFKVAAGPGNTDVVGMNFPLDKGIAGYVAMTGQPIAVSNVDQDPRFAQDFAKTTGYVPRSILATPLISNERVIGVMEVLDKIQAASFGLQDMELLGMFAQQAALAIDQSEQLDRLDEALISGLERIVIQETTVSTPDLLEAFGKINLESPKARDLLALADLFNQIGELGSAERRACLKVLAAFAEYGNARTKFSRGGFMR